MAAEIGDKPVAQPGGWVDMKRVGLTGGIATGKSVVRAELERLGVPTIDADVVARDVVAAALQLLRRFSNGSEPASSAPMVRSTAGSWGRSCSRTKPRA